jgi:hypothetical protein
VIAILIVSRPDVDPADVVLELQKLADRGLISGAMETATMKEGDDFPVIYFP